MAVALAPVALNTVEATLFRLSYAIAGSFKDEFVYRSDLVDRLEVLNSFGVEVSVKTEE